MENASRKPNLSAAPEGRVKASDSEASFEAVASEEGQNSFQMESSGGSNLLRKSLSVGEILTMQHTIGNHAVMRLLDRRKAEKLTNQNFPASAPHLIQRHPSHAPDEEVDRAIQRHPSHAPDEEVDRAFQPQAILSRQLKPDGMHLRASTGRTKFNPERRGMHPGLQRTAARPGSSYIMRVPTTDQLNQKFKRTDGARFKIHLENITLLSETLAEGAVRLSTAVSGEKDFWSKNADGMRVELKKFQAQNKADMATQVQKMLTNAENSLAEFKIPEKELWNLGVELAAIGSQFDNLAATKDPGTADLNNLTVIEQKLTAIEQKLKTLEAKVKKPAFTGEDQDKLKQAHSAIGSLDTVIKAGFGDKMRHKIDKSFSALPAAHVGGNASLVNIGYGEKMEGLGQASGYTYDEKTIGIVLPDNPITGKPMGEGIFASMARSSRLFRALQDMGASEEYIGVDKDSLFKSLVTGKRSNFSGNKTKKSKHMGKLANQGTLVSWIIRHEMGHSVDQQIKFTKNRGKVDAFGGWRTYEGGQINEVVQAMITKAPSLQYNTPLENGGRELGDLLLGVLQQSHASAISNLKRMQADLKNPKNPTESDSRAFKVWVKNANKTELADMSKALDWALTATSQPWMFSDGASDKLAVNGRVFQVDHYGSWVSYLANARANALSSYQFSSPGEWFAEAYAAFYDPKGNLRSALPGPVVEWFKTNLGESGDTGQASLTKGGNLGTLGEIDDSLSDSGAIKGTKSSKLPKDLRNIKGKL